MGYRFGRIITVSCVVFAIIPLHAAVSIQQADTFARKVATIRLHGQVDAPKVAALRTPVSEDEVNSWFIYRAQSVLPVGVLKLQLTILGQGKVAGEMTVDLDSLGKGRRSGGAFDPWSYLGGRVPVSVTGILHTENGQGRFELQTAEVSGVPVPKAVMQQLVSAYSRTTANPAGVNLDGAFPLPANIDKIEVGQGQAVVVQ